MAVTKPGVGILGLRARVLGLGCGVVLELLADGGIDPWDMLLEEWADVLPDEVGRHLLDEVGDVFLPGPTSFAVILGRLLLGHLGRVVVVVG